MELMHTSQELTSSFELDTGNIEVSAETKLDFTEQEIQQSRDFYSEIFAQSSANYTQNQGLTREELPEVINNPDVVKIVLSTPEGRVALPILMPAEKNSWYSQDFLNRHFHKEAAADVPVFHISDVAYLHDVFPEEYPKQLAPYLSELAERDTVLLFDIPSQESEAANIRTQRLLSEAGISAEEVLLGDEQPAYQTYFAGKVHLKNQDLVREQPLTLQRTFQQELGRGRYNQDIIDGTTLSVTFSEEEIDRLWHVYKEPFDDLSKRHPCRQGLDRDEFALTMQDPRTTKIVHKVGGETATLCLLGENLETFSWVNERFYAEQFQEEYNKGQILYFPGLVTDPSKRGERYTGNVVGLIAELVEAGGNEILVAFDCCDETADFLPAILNHYINSTPEAEIDIEEIGKQEYRALKLHTS